MPTLTTSKILALVALILAVLSMVVPVPYLLPVAVILLALAIR